MQSEWKFLLKLTHWWVHEDQHENHYSNFFWRKFSPIFTCVIFVVVILAWKNLLSLSIFILVMISFVEKHEENFIILDSHKFVLERHQFSRYKQIIKKDKKEREKTHRNKSPWVVEWLRKTRRRMKTFVQITKAKQFLMAVNLLSSVLSKHSFRKKGKKYFPTDNFSLVFLYSCDIAFNDIIPFIWVSREIRGMRKKMKPEK